MKNTCNNFSVIIPVLGTKKELKFAEKTIPAIIDLNPHEIIFGIDAPENQTLISTLDQLCTKKKFNRQRYVASKRDKNWNMQLCHIIWDCVTASKNDKLLMTNIDSLVLPPIMIGCDIVGTLNIVAHTSPVIHYVKTIRDKIKTYCHKLIMDRMSNAWSGSIWFYRPYFLECIDFENYRRIYNGNDTFIIECIKKNKKYRYVHSRKFGTQSLDYENNDLYWSQFSKGIYWYANSRDEIQVDSRLINYALKLMHKFPRIGIRLYSFIFIYPYLFKGYQWASKHKDNKIVQIARKSSSAEWSYHGNTLIDDICDWENIGRTGTGFKKI